MQARIANISARPGNAATHHAPEATNRVPSATMRPHSGVGGRMPRPRNDSPAAFIMAQPRFTELCTATTGRISGRRRRRRIRPSPEPPIRAAST
ncbi:hypothetical protein CG51_13865 [Haematobacter missouriensis]|nr:hypothetical protein CG51_13865 [Haematobacter missouriensis]